MKNKHLARLFFILTFLFISTGAYVLLPDQKKIEKPKPAIQVLPWTDTVTNTVITESKETESVIKTVTPTSTVKINPTTTTILEDINQVDTTVEISGDFYKTHLPEKSTAYDAMQNLIDNKKITALIKEYSGIGKFVEEINGTKNDTQVGKYWIYYVNGQPAKVGISAYTLKQNDLITWKYEHSKF